MNSPNSVVIIGGGLGGLLCGAILSKEGHSVTVLEQDKQIGGCLQTFAFHKKVFDACVHYIGGLGKGHSLYQVFSYLGIVDQLRLQELAREGFDEIVFGDINTNYPIANREHFVQSLLPHFPNEEDALHKYLALIDEVAAAFPLYNLRIGSAVEKEQYAQMELLETLRSITPNPRLQQVLAGNNFLYAGVAGVTPFYVHALVTHSYLHSSHKVLPGSSEIAKALGRKIRECGGRVVRNATVIALEEKDGRIVCAHTKSGQYIARQYICAIHPSRLLEITDSKLLRPSYRQRINSLKQSPPSIMFNLVLEAATVSYSAKNIYYHPDNNIFLTEGDKQPQTLALFFTKDPSNPTYADTLSVLAYDDYKNYEQWADTVNRAGADIERPAEYEHYKEELYTLTLEKLSRIIPNLSENIVAHSIASPLTFRDYTGTPQGSLYGIRKDVHLPAAGSMGVRTKIPNLLLTGQNVNLHGVLGVTMTALTTCAELLGMDYLLEKVKAT